MIITNKSEPKDCIKKICLERKTARIADLHSVSRSLIEATVEIPACARSYLTFHKPGPDAVFHNLFSMQCAFSSFEFKVGKTGSKNLQLVLQHCCKTS